MQVVQPSHSLPAAVLPAPPPPQLRLAVLRRILAALRHLASQGRLVRHPLLQAAVDYVNVGLDDGR